MLHFFLYKKLYLHKSKILFLSASFLNYYENIDKSNIREKAPKSVKFRMLYLSQFLLEKVVWTLIFISVAILIPVSAHWKVMSDIVKIFKFFDFFLICFLIVFCTKYCFSIFKQWKFNFLQKIFSTPPQNFIYFSSYFNKWVNLHCSQKRNPELSSE